MDCTRRDFTVGAGAAVAMAAVGAATIASAQEAEEQTAPEGGAELLYDRTTLHAGYDTDQKLTDEQINLIINAAFSAPTGGGQRALDFFPVTDADVLAKIGESHKNYLAPQTAPLVVVIAKARERVKFPELIEMDAGLAAGAMQVQATALGLSTCCLSIAPQADREFNIIQALNIPYKTLNDPMYEPILMVTFGYPAADTTTGASVLNYTESQVHLNGFTDTQAEAIEAAQADADSAARDPQTQLRDDANAAIAEALAGAE